MTALPPSTKSNHYFISIPNYEDSAGLPIQSKLLSHKDIDSALINIADEVENLDLIRVSSCQSAQSDIGYLPTMIDIAAARSQYNTAKNNSGAHKQSSLDSFTHEENYAKWRKLTLVAKSINRFKTLKVERIGSIVNLKKSILNTPIQKMNSTNSKGVIYITPQQMYSGALDKFRDHSAFFELLDSAGKKEIPVIKSILLSDPKENLYDPESADRLANKPNFRGYSPLYIACKNGNLELVKVLLDFKANPFQLCKISPKQKESILVVAARWGHLDVVKHLLNDKFTWPDKEIKKAHDETSSTQTKRFLKTQIDMNKKPFFKRLFTFSQRKSCYYQG